MKRKINAKEGHASVPIRCAKSATCAKRTQSVLSTFAKLRLAKLLLPHRGKTKQEPPREGVALVLAYPKGFEPSTFRVGV